VPKREAEGGRNIADSAGKLGMENSRKGGRKIVLGDTRSHSPGLLRGKRRGGTRARSRTESGPAPSSNSKISRRFQWNGARVPKTNTTNPRHSRTKKKKKKPKKKKKKKKKKKNPKKTAVKNFFLSREGEAKRGWLGMFGHITLFEVGKNSEKSEYARKLCDGGGNGEGGDVKLRKDFFSL